jgi:hypothetical protein
MDGDEVESAYTITDSASLIRRICYASSEERYRESVAQYLALHADGILPHQGWPWQHDTSIYTEYVYAFESRTWVSHAATTWRPCGIEPNDNEDTQDDDDSSATTITITTEGVYHSDGTKVPSFVPQIEYPQMGRYRKPGWESLDRGVLRVSDLLRTSRRRR